MSPIRILVTALVASSTSLLACAATPEGIDLEEETEETDQIGQVSSALINNGGGAGSTNLTSKECTACGCRLVLYEKTGQCNKYYCVCDSDDAAKCAGGKARTVTEPVSPPLIYDFGSFAGGGVFAP